MPANSEQSISPEEILSNEYEYIAQTATQAHEDRSSVVSFFLIAVGSPLAAFFSTEVVGNTSLKFDISILFCGLFFILSVLGTTTILQLSRLRAAWYESMLAMNQMKDFVIRNSSIDIEGAFRWRATTAPSKFKINSVSFYQAVEVAILSGLLFGAFIFFLLDVLKVSNPFIVWGASIGLGLLNIWFQIYLYRQLLK
jgi:hypothetical protein